MPPRGRDLDATPHELLLDPFKHCGPRRGIRAGGGPEVHGEDEAVIGNGRDGDLRYGTDKGIRGCLQDAEDDPPHLPEVLAIAHPYGVLYPPCRVGNVLLKDRLEKILNGQGEPGDLDYLQELGQTVKVLSRCGLGQTSSNPVLTTLKNFRNVYEGLVKVNQDKFQSSFDIKAALTPARKIIGRESVIYT